MGDYKQRLQELKSLEDGWLDGDGLKIHPYCIKLAEKIIPLIEYSERLSIFPTIYGGIQIEWGYEDTPFSLEINWI